MQSHGDLMQDVIVRREENAKNQGINETTNNIAANLIKRGKLSLEDISDATGVSLEALKSMDNGMRATL